VRWCLARRRGCPRCCALLTPAIPLLFFGEEWGATEPFLYFADWSGELREAVRTGRKREFGHGHAHDLPDPCSEDTSLPAGRTLPAPRTANTPAGSQR
jgi:1,4-alpha-glucan branching enzyme/maltooligosyltrehalose trehalohydrolase